MTEKRFTLVKCYNEQWGVVDRSLEGTNQLVLITSNKRGTGYLVNELNKLSNENEQLKSKLKLILEKKYHKFVDGEIGDFKIEDLELEK